MGYRAIQDTVAYSESLNALTAPAERLYWRLLAGSDSHGRLPGSIAKVRARCIPIVEPRPTDETIGHWLAELSAVGRLVRYQADGLEYLQIVDFDENQPPEFVRRRGVSKYPPPMDAGNPGPTPELVRSALDESRLEEEREGEELPAPSEPRREASEAALRNGTLEAAVQAVYGHWRAGREKTSSRYDRMSAKRREKIKARLGEFTAEELCRAIDGVSLDPWPERSRHDDLTIVFRNREQVDKFLELADRPELRTAGRRLGVSIDSVLRGEAS